MHTCSNSVQASKLRYPELKKLLVDINWKIEKKIFFKLEEELESSAEIILLKLDFIRQTGIICSLGVTSCSWNRTSSKKPHRKLKSSIRNSTMLCPEVGIFSVLSVGGDSIRSEFAGTASNTSACRITGQASSRHGCNSAETADDWIPSRNGSHCISNNQGKNDQVYPQSDKILVEVGSITKRRSSSSHYPNVGGNEQCSSPLKTKANMFLECLNS